MTSRTTAPGHAQYKLDTVHAAEAAVRVDNPHIKYVDLDAHGYVVLDVTPERVQADWWNVDIVLAVSDGEIHATSGRSRDGADHIEPAGPVVAPPIGGGGAATDAVVDRCLGVGGRRNRRDGARSARLRRGRWLIFGGRGETGSLSDKMRGAAVFYGDDEEAARQ